MIKKQKKLVGVLVCLALKLKDDQDTTAGNKTV